MIQRFVAAFVLALAASLSFAQTKELKIGVIYDLTGPFAAGGSYAGYLGNKYAIDMINEKGGVEGHKIIATFADAQSKTDVAINEAERLLNDTKVDLLMGLFSSAQCVPLAAKVDAAFWAGTMAATQAWCATRLTTASASPCASPARARRWCWCTAWVARTSTGCRWPGGCRASTACWPGMPAATASAAPGPTCPSRWRGWRWTCIN